MYVLFGVEFCIGIPIIPYNVPQIEQFALNIVRSMLIFKEVEASFYSRIQFLKLVNLKLTFGALAIVMLI